MLLIDKRATAVAKTSLFLLRAEFKKLYPHRFSGKINYVFKYDQAKEIENGEAKLLMKKYPHVIKWEEIIKLGETERHEELNKIKYQTLKNMGAKIGLTFKELYSKKPKLINLIVAKEIEIVRIEEALRNKETK